MQIDDINHSPKNLNLRSLLRFVFVGGVATAIHYLITGLMFYLMGIRMVVASTLGYIVSAAVNYILNARLTFATTQPFAATAPRFIVVSTAGLFLNYLFLTIFLSFNTNPLIAQILTTIGVMIWNYVLSGLWTFKPNRT